MKKRLLTVIILLLVLISTCFLTACTKSGETTLRFVYADGEKTPRGSSPRQVIDCGKVKQIAVYFEMFSSYFSIIESEERIQTYCKIILTGFVVTDDEAYCEEFKASLPSDAMFTHYTIQLYFENGNRIEFYVYKDGTFIYKDMDGKEYVCATNSPRMDAEKVKSVAYGVEDYEAWQET